MQDGHLPHLGDLAALPDSEPATSARHPDIDPFAKVYTGQFLLADEDRVSLHQLAPAEVQDWCLSRITEHEHHIQALRESYGAAARSAIFIMKSYIRALRSAYNDAAAINQLLLPELLIEIFSHVHPAGVIDRPRVPVLRVCRYWRGVLFHAPQFWSNLLSLPSWKLSRPTQLDRFRAALSRSGSTPISLPIRYWDEVVGEILASHAGRVASLTVGAMVRCIENIAQLLEQDMPRLTHLAIFESSLYHRNSGATFTLDFSRHRNIRILELERTYILTPVTPYTSLCHLELRYCIIRPSPTSRPVRALHAVHSALEFFPNLETLSTVYSLSDDDLQGISGPPLAEPRKAIHLPRLRLLEVWDLPAYIPVFLSHLVLPPTTALVLQPDVRRDLSPGPPTVPLFPGITGNDNPEPCASLSLHLKIDADYLARWETHGAGPETPVHPVRITLRLEDVPHCAQVVAHFSRELGGVTALTATGSIGLRGHWETVLPALPRLRSLMYEANLRATREVLDLLAGTGSRTGTRTLCPELVHLGFTWDVSPRVDMRAEDEWRRLREDVSDSENSVGYRPDSSLAASLREFRDVLAERLERRRGRDGTCARIQKLSVAPRQWRFDHSAVIMEAVLAREVAETFGGGDRGNFDVDSVPPPLTRTRTKLGTPTITDNLNLSLTSVLRVDEHLDIMANTDPSLLAEEDRISLNQLAPSEVQEWCLSRIAQYQDDNRCLAKEVLSKNKSHMRALRSVYNDAAPINQHLLPEILMEIFAHVHPAVVPQSHIPVLRVCRYWRRLLFRTSEFWHNLLSLPTWDGWNPRYHVGPFRAALARSASTSLVVFVPYYSQAITSILTPHASCLSSFRAGPTLPNPEEMTLSQLKEEILYRARRRYGLYMYGVVRKEEWRKAALTFSLPLFPNLRSLELRQTYIRTPAFAPYLSLSHLKLDQCAIRPPSSGGLIPPLIAVHAALESFPNLEVLSLIRCLSPPYNPDGIEEVSPVPDLKETVHLPRLRHLELVDTPAYLPPFLSHLIFPATTSLMLEPAYAYDRSRGPAVVPLFPRINPSPSPSPDAELTLSLHFPAADGRSLARWETRGERVRPVRVTLPHAAFTSALIARFTRELAGALAPRRGVATLAVYGRFRHREVQSDPVEYWEELIRALPELRCLACETVWTTKAIAAVLGQRGGGGGFPCARLGEVVLGWSLMHGIDLGRGGGQWRAPQGRDDGVPRDRTSESAESQSAKELSPESQLAKQLSDFCDTVRPCLAARAGHCEPVGKLGVSFHCEYLRCKCRDVVLEGWQAALIEQRLREALGDLVGDVVVRGHVS